MSKVQIIISGSDNDKVVVTGEVKAVDMTGLPSIASITCKRGGERPDTFEASPGRHTFQFRVEPRCKIELSTEVDGKPVGRPVPFDTSDVNAGRRYNFEVPS